LYHDFNHDGYSERVEIGNYKEAKKYFLLFLPYLQKDAYKVKDQFNFHEPLNYEWIFFGDYTADGYDETIVFTQKGDSLYLSIIDVNLKKWILDRHYILSVQKPNPHHIWDIGEIFCHLLDVNNDEIPEIVFAIHSGFSQQPRGIFIFDINKRKIINRFISDSGINNLLIYDLTGDEKPEIILVGHATGNIQKKSKYTDFKSWLFVLDQQLNFVFPPENFGEYPSNLFCEPLEIYGERYLLITYNYAGEKSFPDYICLMNAKGKIVLKRNFTEWELHSPFINRESNPPDIYIYDINGEIVKLNTNLQIIHKNQLRTKQLGILDLIDLNIDEKSELICISFNSVFLLNQNLKKIAYFPLKKIANLCFSRRYNGPGNPVEFAVHDSKYYYLYSLNKNYIYSWLPFIFIGINGSIFFLLLILHRIITILNIYITYFFFSLRKSKHGILILDHKGRIFYFNSRVQTLLHFSEPIFEKQHFTRIFKERPAIAECIQKGMYLQKTYQCDINFIDADKQFKGEMIVTPFRTSFNFIYAYLIEIQDHTQPILTDRLRVWSRSVQKMAHDIKQPLSSVTLNLKALQIRLEQMDISDREEIQDDLQMMKTELEKVRQITNNFLKFVNLETPKFQVIDLSQTIRNSLQRFTSLFDKNLQIELELDSSIKNVWADPQQLELVLHTLIENAIDAMKGQGHIRISTMLVHNLEENFNKFVQIEIVDSGPGIDLSIKDQIFEPFFTTKTNGTGMGLAIAKKIVEDHNGQITVYSKKKIGTVAQITLPVKEENGGSSIQDS